MLPLGAAAAAGFVQGVRSRAPKPLEYRVGESDYSVLPTCYTEVKPYRAEVIYGAECLRPTFAVQVAVEPPVPWWRRLLRWLVVRPVRPVEAPRVGDGWDECLDAIRAGEMR